MPIHPVPLNTSSEESVVLNRIFPDVTATGGTGGSHGNAGALCVCCCPIEAATNPG